MNWVLGNTDTISDNLIAHVWLSIPPIVISFLLSVPIGLLVSRLRKRRGAARATGSTIVVVSSLLYAIPSFPFFLALPAILGTSILDPVNVVIALTVYGIALMARSAADAIDSVDADVVNAAEALGYSPAQRFFRVELPLAGPVLLAGIRVVAVSTVSLVTVGALLGIPNLGFLLTDGLKRGISVEILTGIVLTIVLALVIDGLLVLIGRLIMPWTRGSGRAARSVRRRAATDVRAGEVSA
ncbi:osmoprotectant transport system permease protein [Curtobacterium sp. UNCCL20]|uniref:ABC transporter permease n=1 Tax=Curtobacterium sp. UNCCL20 TaxID=1502773 RepID=UPI00088269C6|nr:ABC transporter permease subunit [Curtobacterium sp. UNCCL20]SDR05231.1 osmoprotectant transport system permease protein [Curtobacterium sp. UNCCL20]